MVPIRRQKVVGLLAYLAVTGTSHTRDALADLLFPRQDRQRAYANFRQILSILRRHLDEGALDTDRHRVTLRPDRGLWVDALEFNRLLDGADAEQAAQGGAPPDAERSLEHAIALYRGEFLRGLTVADSVAFDNWRFFEQESLERRYAAALERLVDMYERQGRLNRAIEVTRRLWSRDELDERVGRRLMRLYALTGSKPSALRLYEQLRGVLDRELGEKPDAYTEALYRDIRASRLVPSRPEPLPGATGEPATHGVPLQLTSFVGRRHELAALGDLIREGGSRLITLTGPGGCGKTRLALQAAELVRTTFSGRIEFVSYADETDAAAVGARLASTLGITEMVDDRMEAALRVVLRRGRWLLILDNFEPVVSAAPFVGELLSACPQVTVMVTSRESLRIRGEREFPVPALRLPRRSDRIDRSDAVELFVTRVRDVRPDFQLTADNASTIAAICTRLDGLPLAIELAAVRCKALSPAALLALLSDSLAVLDGGPRDAPARQQTIRNAIAWSYELLAAGEQRLLARLSVFAAGFTLEAAQEVCGSDAGSTATINGIDSLVNKSLLQRRETGGRSRYSLLETVRDYARERLEESGERRVLEGRHVAYFTALAEEAEPDLPAPGYDAETGRHIETEHSNLLTALTYAVERFGSTMAVPLIAALWPFWKAHPERATRWIERAVGDETTESMDVTHAKAHIAAGDLHQYGNSAAAKVAYQRALEAFEKLGDVSGATAARARLGITHAITGDLVSGRELLEEAVAASRAGGHRLATARFAVQLGKVDAWLGETELGSALAAEGLAGFRELGDAEGVRYAQIALGEVLLNGDPEAARGHLEQVLPELRAVGKREQLGECLEYLAAALLRLGQSERAKGYALEALDLYGRTLANHAAIGHLLRHLGAIAVAAGDLERGVRLFGMYHGLFQQGGWRLPARQTRSAYERDLARARKTLGAERFDTLFRDAVHTPLADAVAYAAGTEGGVQAHTPPS
jgi:predicted ATPase/DNA-binding SARP family transcriptional activator